MGVRVRQYMADKTLAEAPAAVFRAHVEPAEPTRPGDLWHVKKVNPASMVHLTEKAVELSVRAIQYSSRPGENVLDLFGGSGSTLIACEQTGRRCFMAQD